MARTLRGGALGAVLALSIAAPAGAAPAAVTGGTSITLTGNAAKALKRDGVRFVAVDPASVSKTTLTLPMTSATIGTVARGYHAGVVQLVHGTGRKAKRVALTGAQTRMAAERTYTTAKLGTTKVTLLTYAKRAPQLDPQAGTARLTAAVSLTDRAATLIAERLGVKRFKARRLGTATIAAVKPAAVAPPATAAPTSPGTAASPVPAGNVTAASFTWRPRESFIRYINSESGTSTTASDGASAGPKEVRPGTDAPLVYSFLYPFASGNADGTSTLLAFGGKVTFSWPGRGIDLSFAQPQLRFGAASSASFVFGGKTAGDAAGTLVRTLDLNLAGAASHTVDGATETYADIPATLTAEGAEAFAGFYSAGSEFGTVSASWTRTP